MKTITCNPIVASCNLKMSTDRFWKVKHRKKGKKKVKYNSANVTLRSYFEITRFPPLCDSLRKLQKIYYRCARLWRPQIQLRRTDDLASLIYFNASFTVDKLGKSTSNFYEAIFHFLKMDAFKEFFVCYLPSVVSTFKTKYLSYLSKSFFRSLIHQM